MKTKWNSFKTALKIFFPLMWVFCFLGCNRSRTQSPEDPQIGFSLHKAVVKSVKKTGKQTYFNVEENGVLFWMVVPGQEFKEGDQLFYSQENVSARYQYNDQGLGVLFDSVLFVSSVTSSSMHKEVEQMENKGQNSMPRGHGGGRVAPEKKEVMIEPAHDGISVAELYRNREHYSGKKVRVRGLVVKVNANIMQRNWVHIQDGTSFSGDFDLTITTQEKATPGDTITFEGTLSIDKDFT